MVESQWEIAHSNSGGVFVATVARTKENLRKCQCIRCPSYNFACKLMAMPGNVILLIGNTQDKPHAEAMFCAYEKSHCITEEKGCLCSTCLVFKENDLGKGYFCISTGGK